MTVTNINFIGGYVSGFAACALCWFIARKMRKGVTNGSEGEPKS